MAGPCWIRQFLLIKKKKKLRCFPDSALAELGLQIKGLHSISLTLSVLTVSRHHPTFSLLVTHTSYLRKTDIQGGRGCWVLGMLALSQLQFSALYNEGDDTCRSTAPSISSHNVCDLGKLSNSLGLLCTFWKRRWQGHSRVLPSDYMK